MFHLSKISESFDFFTGRRKEELLKDLLRELGINYYLETIKQDIKQTGNKKFEIVYAKFSNSVETSLKGVFNSMLAISNVYFVDLGMNGYQSTKNAIQIHESAIKNIMDVLIEKYAIVDLVKAIEKSKIAI